jgi:predicted nucleic acid-binding protein
MSVLLDTNVVSEAIKPRPAHLVVAWLAAQPSASVYLSVLTIGEIEQGIARAPIHAAPNGWLSGWSTISSLASRGAFWRSIAA